MDKALVGTVGLGAGTEYLNSLEYQRDHGHITKACYDSSMETASKARRMSSQQALATETSSIKAHRGNLDMSGQYRSVRVFVKREGKWQQVLLQRTKIGS